VITEEVIPFSTCFTTMETFDIDTFMKRVDKADSANELASLQLELLAYSKTISPAERKALVSLYMSRLKTRSSDIHDNLTHLENAHVNA
jgi:hypothetical protein